MSVTSRPTIFVSALLVVGVVAALGFIIGPLAALAGVGGVAALVLGIAFTSGNLDFTRSKRPADAQDKVEIDSKEPLYVGLGWAIGLALIVRFFGVLALNATSAWISFAPDAIYWEGSGTTLLAYWGDSTVPLDRWFNQGATLPFYSTFNAIVVAVFGSARFPASFINSIISMIAAYVFGSVARQMYGLQAGRRAFLMCMFFPSVVLWSCMNIREAWSLLVISLVLLFAHRLRARFSLLDAAFLMGAMAAMFWIRSYLVPLLLGGVALSYLAVRIRQVPYALAMLGGLVIFGMTFGAQLGLDPALLSADSLETMDQMRRNLAFGGSAYGATADTRTVAGTLAYLPEGIARFILAPFPWAVRGTRQMLTVPESFIWYWVVGLTIWRLAKNMRTHLVRIAPTFFVLVFITCAYGVVSGNEGTAYRHRAQVMVLFLVLVSSRPVFSAPRSR